MSDGAKPPQKNIYSIPASLPFADTLAKGLLEEVSDSPEKLAPYLILLPTRRACRTLRAAFLRQRDGKPILLPKMHAFGDIDADELLISATNQDEFETPPAIPPLKRQLLLAKTIGKIPDISKDYTQNMALAGVLGQLMDEVYTENRDLKDLPDIVDREAFAAHWQITIDFLSILSEHWPKVLEEEGMIDAADRRNRLILALNNHWQSTPPDYPVIAAGSTGSIPATAALLDTISTLPKGSVILPGLDQSLSEEDWNAVEEAHPQATLKHLIETLNTDRQDIKTWQDEINEDISDKLFSSVMLPPSQTDKWQSHLFSEKQKQKVQKRLTKISRYDCENEQEEATLIALILRETLENEAKTAALITPDRNLARRVAATCQRWGINIDDSAGQPLSETPVGQYLRLSAKTVIDGIQPLSFLSLLKHDLAAGNGFKNFRKTVRLMDQQLLRGIKPQNGFAGFKNHYQRKLDDPDIFQKPDESILNLLNHLEVFFEEPVSLFSDGYHSFKDLLENHLTLAETLATSNLQDGEQGLWSGEDGEATASFFAELQDHANNIPDLTGNDYLALIENLMSGVIIRPKFGTHPRLSILGQLEARLVKADRVILGGLNEGTWPPDPGHDPWMSRPMREKFGLPLPERAITLAAHDFVQGLANEEVFLTRSERVEDAPSVPSRWLQRLDTFLQAIQINPEILRQGPHKSYLSALDKTDIVTPFERPAPTPPVEARPKKLSVTKIETWLKDPYHIYARYILGLKKLDPIEKELDAAERGNILHDILDQFIKQNPKLLPEKAQHQFIDIAKEIIEGKNYDPAVISFWMPRLYKIANWIIENEKKWRQNAVFKSSETKGQIEFEETNTAFTLTARVDRIDQLNTGEAAIIDYKSGGQFSLKKIENAELPQLPLEALILQKDGFDFKQTKVASLSYWKITGGKETGKIYEVSNEDKIQKSIELAYHGLINLINKFDNEKTPYLAIPDLDNAPNFNDYAHLERVKEWAALGDNSEEAA